MKRLLLLEDDSSLGATLSERLEKENYDVKWCKSIGEAKKSLSSAKYDMGIFDVGLPDGSGFDLAKEVRESSLMPFIFVTALGSAEERLEGYEIGAEEYIPKPFHLKELIMRVKHVLENHSYISYEFDNVFLDLTSLEIKHPDKTEKLNFKEASLLKLLIERAPKPVSRDDILNEVWGLEDFPSNRTVDNMIVRLRQVLGHLGENIESVRGVGYKWADTGGRDV